MALGDDYKPWSEWSRRNEHNLTSSPRYYILEVDTLVEEDHYDDPHQPGLKAYSVIKIDDNGAHEVDRAYRGVKEALEVWPEAMPPTDNNN